jgi:uncharacterized membrane protein YczE
MGDGARLADAPHFSPVRSNARQMIMTAATAIRLAPPLAARPDRYWGRVTQLAAASVAIGAADAFVVAADLGASPYSALLVGLASTVGVPVPAVMVVFAGMLAFGAWRLLGVQPGRVALAGPVLASAGFAAATPTAAAIGSAAPVISATVGMLVIAVALGVALGTGLGRGIVEGLCEGVARAIGASYAAVTTGFQLTCLTGAFALGGPLGVGTVVTALLLGPISARAARQTTQRWARTPALTRG